MKMSQESDAKSRLVLKIYSISTSRVSCSHSNVRSRFVDWYRILDVDENAGVDLIRKRYHKLALQIHPDKNNHPKAEIAFKLIYEAYTCLSDESKRKSFNSERLKNFCRNCNRIPYGSQIRTQIDFSRTLKDIRDRFREENRVIESCLKSNNNNYNSCSRKDSPAFSSPCRKESPVFDPSAYAFSGYPHVRNRVSEKSRGLWCRKQGKKNMNDFPVFENGSDWRSFRNRSTCVRT